MASAPARRAGLAALAALALATLTAAQFAPSAINVTAGDGSLAIEWLITIPGGDSSIRSFQVTAAPTTPAPVLFINSPNTTIWDFNTNGVDWANWQAVWNRCVNSIYTTALCFSTTQPPTRDEVFTQTGGALQLTLRPYHGFAGTTGTVGSASAYLRNGLPIITRTGLQMNRDVVVTSTLGFNPFTSTPTGNTHAGLVVWDYDSAGVVRPLIQFYYHHFSTTSTANYLYIRQLNNVGSGYSTFLVVSPVGSQFIQLAIQRNAREKYYRFFYAIPTLNGGRWTYIAARDVMDSMLPVDTQFNATIGLFGSNEHTTLNRTMSFDRYTETVGEGVNNFLWNLTNWEARTAATGLCQDVRPVTRTGIFYSQARSYYRVVLTGLLNAQPYRITVASVGATNQVPVVAGTFTPQVNWPVISQTSAQPALFLDALTTAVGPVNTWRDLSGNNRHVYQYITNLQPTSYGITSAFPRGGLNFPFARNEMVASGSADAGLDFANSPKGLSFFTAYRIIYTIGYAYSFSVVSRMNYMYGTSGAQETSRPMDDNPGWDIYAQHPGYTTTSPGTPNAAVGPGMRIVIAKNAGSTPMNPSYRHVGIRYGWWGSYINTGLPPDYNLMLLYTYNFYPATEFGGGFQIGTDSYYSGWVLDGCRGINLGFATDQCWAPDPLASGGPVTQAATTYPMWEKGYGSDNLYYPGAPFIRPTTNADSTMTASTFTSSPGALKVSDAGKYGTGAYMTKYFYGQMWGVLIYKDALNNRQDRETVQRWMGERYGLTCPIMPYSSATYSGANAACASGKAVSAGVTCNTACAAQKVRIGGISSAETYTCAGGVMTSKGLWCGNSCPIVTIPANAAQCRLQYINETWSYPANTRLRDLVKYNTVPPMPISAADASWAFDGGILRGSRPYPIDACAVAATVDSMLTVNRATWADLSVAPGAVTYKMDVTLEDVGAQAGMGFRVSTTAGGTTQYYRFVLTAGTVGAQIMHVLRTPTASTVRMFGTPLLPTFNPVPGQTYALRVETSGIIIRAFIDNQLMFDTSDSAIPHGAIGAFVGVGGAAFDNWEMAGACQTNGNCQALEGSSCTYTCAPGFVPVGDVTRSCGATGLSGTALKCVPPPPVPLNPNPTFSIFEDAAVGFIMGTVNVSVSSNGTLDKVVLFSIVSGNNETMRDQVGNPLPGNQEYTEVFDVGFCSGVLSLQAGGALNFRSGKRTFNMMIKATLAVDDTVFTMIPVTVNVLNARGKPVYLEADGVTIMRQTTRVVDENAPVGTLIGNPVAAVNTEGPTQILSYAIVSGDPTGMFRINNATGQLIVNKLGLDFEGPSKTPSTPNDIDIFVQARDRDFPNLQATVQVTVSVKDIDDAPVVPTQNFEIIEDAVESITITKDGKTGPNIVGTVTGVTDDDANEVFTYGLSAANPTFSLNETTGEIQLAQPIVLGPILSRPYLIVDGRAVRAVYRLTGTVRDSKSVLRVDGVTVSGPITSTYPINIYVMVNTSYGGNPVINDAYLEATQTRTNLDTFGNQALIIKGEGLSAVNTLSGTTSVVVNLTAAAGPRSPARGHLCSSCVVMDDSTIRCAATTAGYGADLGVVVTWGTTTDRRVMATKTGSPVLVSYAAPVLTAVAYSSTRVGSVAPPGNSVQRLNTDGSQAIQLTVRQLGPAGTPIAITYHSADNVVRYTAQYFSHVPPSNIGATGTVIAWLVPGVFANLLVRVQVGNQISDIVPTLFISYDRPLISALRVAAGTNATLTTYQTVQSVQQQFEIVGSNFGRGNDPIMVFMSMGVASARSLMINNVNTAYRVAIRTVCTKDVNNTHTIIACNMPSGFGQGYQVRVTVGNQTSDFSTNALGYALPTITGISGLGARNADTAGGQEIIITGDNLGPVSVLNADLDPAVPAFTPFSITYAKTGQSTPYVAQNCRVVAAAAGRQISCQLAPGSGKDLRWTIIVAGQVPPAQPTTLTNYGVPIITSLSRSATTLNSQSDTFNTVGNEIVYIDGANFGPGVVGGAPAAPTSVTYKLTLEQVRSDLNTSLGAAADGTITYTAGSCVMTREHYQLQCRTAEGAGKSLDWTVVVDGQTSTQPMLGYRRPTITSITKFDASPATAVSTDGNETLILNGADFGPAINCRTGLGNFFWPEVGARRCLGYIQSVTYGPTGTEFDMDDVHLVSHSQILVRTKPGYGGPFRFTLVIAEQTSRPSTATFGYARPFVTQVSPNSGPTVTPANSYEIVVSGQNFGLQDNTAEVSILLGNPGDNTVYRSMLATYNPEISSDTNGNTIHSVSFFLPPGVLPDRAVRVVVHPRGQPTSPLRVISDPTSVNSNGQAVFSYNAPNIDSVVVAAVPNDGPLQAWILANVPGVSFATLGSVTQLIVLGSNFGQDALTAGDNVARKLVFQAPNAGELASVYSWTNNRIVAYTTNAAGTLQAVQEGTQWDAAVQSAAASNAYAYSARSPTIDGVVGSRTGLSTGGGDHLTLSARYLDSTQISLEVFVDTLNRPDGSTITTKANIIDPATGRVLSTMADFQSVIIAPGRAANPNPQDPDSAVFTLTFVVPPGEGTNRKVVLCRDGPLGCSDTNIDIAYGVPTITSYQVYDPFTSTWGAAQTVSPTSYVIVPTLGTRLRLLGSNFGLCPKVTMATTVDRYIVGAGDTLCTATGALTLPAVTEPANSNVSLTFNTVRGQGSGHSLDPVNGFQVSLNVGGQLSNAIRWRYADATISTVTPEGRTAGGTTISLTGRNFGSTRTGMSIFIGPYACGGITYTPSTTVNSAATQTVRCVLAEGSGGPYDVVFRSVPYDCGAAPVRCTATRANGFTYSRPRVTRMILGGTGNSSGTLGPDAQALAEFIGNNSAGAAPVPSWLTLPVSDYSPYVEHLRQIGDFGSEVMNRGFPVRLPSAGGDLLTIEGDNFGQFNSSIHCIFFAWGGRDRSRPLTCDGANSFVGEEEIPALAILHWSHTRIIMVAPQGYGAREVIPVINGVSIPWALAMHYQTPQIVGDLSPPRGDTEGGTVITASGMNMGAAPAATSTTAQRANLLRTFPTTLSEYLTLARPPMAVMRVKFFRKCVSNHLDADGNRPTVVDRCQSNSAMDFKHDHDMVRFLSSPGIGVNRTVTVEVWDTNSTTGEWFNYTSNPVLFNYNPPFIYSTTPRPIRMDVETAHYNLQLQGENLGNPPGPGSDPAEAWSEEERLVLVSVANQVCETPSRFVSVVGTRQLIELRCTVPPMTVGYKNVSYTVAGQANFNREEASGAVFMACRQEFFGKPGEVCMPCPYGAECRGFDSRPVVIVAGTQSEIDGGIHSYPRPLPGFFNLNSTDRIVQRLKADGKMGESDTMYSSCPQQMQDRFPGRDVCIVGCEPPEACLADNYCAEGYRSLPPLFRCTYCDIGFYKRNNECVKCPNSPYALVIGFIALVMFAAGASYVLNKKKINIGFIAIGVDWAQVIAIFAASKVAWPPVVKELFNILSAFNLNIEIVAPECIVPDLQYRQKWSFIMALPLSLTIFFMIVTAFQVFYRAVIKGRKVTLANQGSSFASMVLLLMYVLYIYLTRNILDIFNCQPREPDEGKYYLTAGSGEECYVAGGTQQVLYPAAAAAAFFYIVCYPASIATVLFRNRDLALEDQLLRAKGVGDDKLTNPRAYVLRKRFSRVYYQFKPDSVFWVLAILLRKFCLAATYILFNRNASFQLAAALLVIFVAYAAQMKYAPYMGPGDFEDVLKNYEAKAISGDVKAAQMWARLKNVESRGRKKVHRNLMSAGGKIDAGAILGLLRTWLFAYNTVEEILLFSAGTVALMGIMYASLNSKSTNFADARDSVTWVIVGAIILTIIYFFVVVFTEVYVLYTEEQRRKAMERRAKTKGKGKLGSDDGDKDREAVVMAQQAAGELHVGAVESNFNPMFEGSQSTAGLREVIAQTPDVPSVDLWRVFRQGYQELRDELNRLSQEAAEIKLRRQKMEAAAAVLESATGQKIALPEMTDAASGEKYKAGRRKQEFGPVGADSPSGTNPLAAMRRTPSMRATGGAASPALQSAKSLRSLAKK